VYNNGVLKSTVVSGTAGAVGNKVERIVILGARLPATRVTATEAGVTSQLSSLYDADLQRLTIRKPDLAVAGDWSITLS
jgi:hypothetical protein